MEDKIKHESTEKHRQTHGKMEVYPHGLMEDLIGK